MVDRSAWSRRDVVAALLAGACLLWSVTVLPVFALSMGMFGRTVGDGLRSLFNEAMSGEPIAMVMVTLTLPLLSVPWLIWVFMQDR